MDLNSPASSGDPESARPGGASKLIGGGLERAGGFGTTGRGRGAGVRGCYRPVISHQPDAVYGVAALVLSYSAYVSEVYRAGINSVHQSQVAAARSLGLSQRTALRYVILPQAVRNIIPPLLNDFISLQKDTALVGVLGVIEANQAANIYASLTFNYSSFTVAPILFLILTIPLP